MKKVFGGLAILLIVGLVMTACSGPFGYVKSGARAADPGIVWKGADDIAVAADIDAVENAARKNASGPKITSNAHSADFPGIYFIWDSKQSDSGYLKVLASVFEKYDSFILTAKVSNTYWDFDIAIQSGQIKTTDDCYVFFIPKVAEVAKNINMVFIGDLVESSKYKDLLEIVEQYYGNPDDASTVPRIRKMQALIMEIAIRAKTRNPYFQVIPQDTLQYAFIDGNSSLGYDQNLIGLLDGWGIESNSAGTLTSLNNLRNVGIQGTATANAASTAAVTTNQNAAAAQNVLYFPRLTTAVYTAAGVGNDHFYPFYATNGDYMLVEDAILAGLGGTLNNNNILRMLDAKNYLYMINPNRYVNWDTWDDNYREHRSVNASESIGQIVPSADGPYLRSQLSGVPASVTDTNWDWWWRVKGYDPDSGRAQYIADLKASPYDVIYIDPHYGDYYALTREEVNSLKYKPGGGRRLIIGYLSIGTAEAWRWFAGEGATTYIESEGEDYFLCGAVSGGNYTPGYVRYPQYDVPNWAIWQAYSGQYADEATVQYWHPEWRDIMVRGGSEYKNPRYDHTLFSDGRSSIDKIVDMGFDGVYLDNVSRADSNAANWTAWTNYSMANPGWYLEKH